MQHTSLDDTSMDKASHSEEDSEDFQNFVQFSQTICSLPPTSNADPGRDKENLVLLTGGFFEIGRANKGDIDVMIILAERKYLAMPYGERPSYECKTVLWICNDSDVHRGYTRLMMAGEGQLFSLHQLGKLTKWEKYLEGEIKGPAVSVEIPYTIGKRECKLSYDFVLAISSPLWPVQAEEWTKRKRKWNWPTEEVVTKCSHDGCHLVQVAHHNSVYKFFEFRFSFSLAERRLMRTWRQTQKYAYMKLKNIKTEVNERLKANFAVEPVLSSYHLKTLMFWACEEKPPEFWNVGSIQESMHSLLAQMTEWLDNRSCPNYFIPSNNMFDHFGSDVKALTLTVDAMRRILDSADVRLDRSCTVSKSDFVKHNKTLSATMPRGLLLVLRLIYFRLHADTGLGSRNNTFALIMMELQDLYRALCAQQQYQLETAAAVENGSGSRTSDEQAIRTAETVVENMLNKSTQPDEFPVTIKTRKVNSLAEDWIRSVKLNESIRQRLDVTTWRKTDLSAYSKLTVVRNRIPLPRRQSTVNAVSELMITANPFYSSFIKELFGADTVETELLSIAAQSNIGTARELLSLTAQFVESFSQSEAADDADRIAAADFPLKCVRMSWFTSMAYLANFQATVRRDFASALRTCNEIIETANYIREMRSATEIFTVQLSSRWSSIFDANIQYIIGLFCLNESIIQRVNGQPADCEEVFVPVCPVMFALYIKTRCVLNMDSQAVEKERVSAVMHGLLHKTAICHRYRSKKQREAIDELMLRLLINRLPVEGSHQSSQLESGSSSNLLDIMSLYKKGRKSLRQLLKAKPVTNEIPLD